MTNIRRYFIEGDTIFLTHITYNRRPILIDNFDLLWSAVQKHVNNGRIISWVILPDHFHIILNNNDIDIPTIIKKIKLTFSANLRKSINKKSGRIWQFRFWDHIIRNQDDLNNHIDYIHYNPVKHGLVRSPFEWKYSSLHDYVGRGYYPRDWGVREKIKFDGDFGE